MRTWRLFSSSPLSVSLLLACIRSKSRSAPCVWLQSSFWSGSVFPQDESRGSLRSHEECYSIRYWGQLLSRHPLYSSWYLFRSIDSFPVEQYDNEPRVYCIHTLVEESVLTPAFFDLLKSNPSSLKTLFSVCVEIIQSLYGDYFDLQSILCLYNVTQ